MSEPSRPYSGFEPLVVKEDFETGAEPAVKLSKDKESASHTGKASEMASLKLQNQIETSDNEDSASSTESVDGEGSEEDQEEEEDEEDSSVCPSDSYESTGLSPTTSIGDVSIVASSQKRVVVESDSGKTEMVDSKQEIVSSKVTCLSTVVDLSGKKAKQGVLSQGEPLKDCLNSGLSTLLNEPRRSEGTEVVKSSAATPSFVEMPATSSTSNSKAGTGNYKKPAVKPKPVVRNPESKSNDKKDVLIDEVTGVERSILSSTSVGLPPMPPSLVSPSTRDKEERGFSPLRHNKTFARGPTCSTTGCPAWTCCEGAGNTCNKQGRSGRSMLSPLRQMTGTSLACDRNPGDSNFLQNSSSGKNSHKNGRKKPSNVKRNYAASLPDPDWNSASPFGFDLSYQFDHHGKKLHHGNHSFRGHPGPTKNCKNKHLWARASLERDVISAPQSSPTSSNRHSSYHPYTIDSSTSLLGTNNETAAAAAAAAAAAYSHVLHSSRPNSPLCPSVDSNYLGSAGRICNDWELGNCCLGCNTKTFPRSSNRLTSIGCHCCHHHCDTGSGTLGGSLLGLDYEDRLLRLESDKDTLHLQVSVLSDQIEAQTSKIQDLEKLLDDKKNILETTEEQLQRELVTRSGLETQKLELMTEISGLRLKQATLERENIELKGRLCTGTGRSLTDLNYPAENRIWDKPPAAPGTRGTSPAQTASELGQRLRLTNDCSQGLQHHQQRVQTPPANAYRRVDQTCSFGTLPRRNQPAALSTFNSAGGGVNLPVDNSTKCNSLSSGNINAISVNFSQNGAGGDEWQRRGNASLNATNSSKSTSGGGHKSRRILRILGKLKRSNSGGLDNEVVPETHGDQPASHNTFVRGGLRATAAPRLGWVKEPTPVKMPEGPITSWDSEAVVAWLNFLGLGMYANEVKRWVKSGQQLLDATTQELEKELSIKNGLHRKKLGLALHYLKHPDDDDNAGKLDYHWVTRWLDDVGLPQYKEAFAEGRVDGRILSHLTAEDLFSLKVTSMMHHSCIKRGIQILRIHRFHPSCLCRRGSTAGLGGENLTKDPKHVATWTNHRVMEWLKAVDLAEYAPNLRGSGVHGALIVFEPRFNSELLATLLSIPGNKTLLRRHLSLQFNELIGRHIVQEKRLAELAPDFIPINPTVKVKPAKKAQFALRKKRLSNEFSEELLCPLDWNSYPTKWDSQSQLNSDSFESEGSLAGGKVSNI
ncbi:unnamed protein product [Allacma fusca]|uniref:SAM domain-containing protein n=1 Tax=Allacma fusca TaxID=39272 RepID=A0A8J2Q564_9HEXA|nr:unnamed protein product [Allacma fusca]